MIETSMRSVKRGSEGGLWPLLWLNTALYGFSQWEGTGGLFTTKGSSIPFSFQTHRSLMRKREESQQRERTWFATSNRTSVN
jgi:hypothetical protein